MMEVCKKLSLLLFGFIFLSFSANPAEKIVGIWQTGGEEPSRIEIFQREGKYFGKIIWLANPTEDGAPRTDMNNPNAELRQRKILGLELLKAFEFDPNKQSWVDGTIYDPMSGNTYSCTIRREKNTLQVRGYIGIALFGRTEIWTKVN